MKEIKTIKILLFLFFAGLLSLLCDCSSLRPKVSMPSYTLLREYEDERYIYNLNTAPIGGYIVLNNNLQTYMAHDALQEEIGIWRMRGDTLFLEPQLFTSLWQKEPGKYHQIERPTPKQYLMTKNFAYEITDYWEQLREGILHSSDSIAIEYIMTMDSLTINQEKAISNGVRRTFFIMHRSEPYKYQRDFDW